MLNELKAAVLAANLELPSRGLVTYTWGNVSGIDREKGLVAIKPSGVDYNRMREQDIVLVDLDGQVVEGELNPSSDLPTHLVLYKAFANIGGVCHVHARWSTAWAQAGSGVPAYGTTHADYFYGEIPCTRDMTESEIRSAYEANTGRVIAEAFQDKDPDTCPAVLVKNHGPFTWGKDAQESVHNAVVLEEVAMMALQSQVINPEIQPMPKALLDKHYLRKHGSDAYYGQAKP